MRRSYWLFSVALFLLRTVISFAVHEFLFYFFGFV